MIARIGKNLWRSIDFEHGTLSEQIAMTIQFATRAAASRLSAWGEIVFFFALGIISLHYVLGWQWARSWDSGKQT